MHRRLLGVMTVGVAAVALALAPPAGADADPHIMSIHL